ncbi:MAG TPA: hypothetical protein VI462_02760 [Acidimicrobiia bacterium]|jgi:hypothetical protein
MSYLGLLIAIGLGVWTYLDAKKLQARNITVGSIPPPAWGILVCLVAIVFGILYLILRPRAIRRAQLGP